MKCPRVVHLSYHKIRVFFTDKMPTDAVGYADVEPARITISDKLPAADEVNTVIHELLHLMFTTYRIDEKSDEERIVTALANGITETITRNPKLVEYILTRLSEGD